ncbi:anti-sigma factor family protein [Deminuibacter soli]|uniref:Zf-HC2 domain-containing protein n=1 Tax=Deminuibacter soli TaxID=2291815 RepID=A0A3E1NR43_9BACT|nr:hypothetical protein [Deminuibacter soli]RFM30367.1 hypothetical protein DXN05_05260 [Deminuibacter soli]
MKWIISCRDASKFILQDEEKKLTVGERRRLRFHLAFCYMCRLFSKQAKLITRCAHDAHEHSTAAFSEDEKQQLLQNLNNSH